MQTYKVKYAWPQILLYDTPHLKDWHQRCRDQINSFITPLFALVSVVFLAHIYFDKLAELKPYGLFVKCRVSLSCIAALFCLASRLSIFRQPWWTNTALLLIYGIILIIYQSISMRIDSKIPFYFCIFIAASTAMLSKLNSALTVIYYFGFGFIALSIAKPVIEIQGKTGEVFSLFLSVGTVLLIYSSRIVSDVELLLGEFKQIALQEKIELERSQHLKHIRSLLPRRIDQRLDFLVSTRKYPIAHGIETVMKEEDKPNVAAFFCDIRAFTQNTKLVGSEPHKEVKRVLQDSTDIVEEYWGIPKPSGDLILSYYDEISADVNIVNAFTSAWQTQTYTILRQKLHVNGTVKRYYLLSYGLASVGNMGGVNSAREITVIGPPYNILARLDPLTKEESLGVALEGETMIVTKAFYERIINIYEKLEVKEINLSNLGLSIRDFPEEPLVYCIPRSTANIELFNNEIITDAKKIGTLNKYYIREMYKE